MNVSRGFREDAVIAETSVGLLWRYGPTQASHAALVSLCQKVVDTERTPSSGPSMQFLVCLCQNQQSLRKDAFLWTVHTVPEKSLPGISRHQKDAAFWTAYLLPGNLYLKSAERVSSSTWLPAGKRQFPMASVAKRLPKKTSVGLAATGGAVHTEVQTRVAKVRDATSLDP